jgi:PIN domain nuclease of toxin-antitoxin system
VRVLLDTHTFIWFIVDNPALGPQATRLIEDPDNEVLVSMATPWEIAIKMSLGKLKMEATFDQLFPSQLQINNITLLPIEVTHLAQVVTLPWHHRDPFDRLMIAQSMVENLPILSRDPAFDDYAVERFW